MTKLHELFQINKLSLMYVTHILSAPYNINEGKKIL